MSDLSEPMIVEPAAPFARATRGWLPVWHTRERKTLVLFGAMVALCFLFAIVQYRLLVGQLASQGPRWVNHMFLFWGWSRFIHQVSPAALIYDSHALYRFELGLPGAHPRDLPFAYPPILLLFIWPLALVGPVVAFLAWCGVSLTAYAGASWQQRHGWGVAVLGLIAPATLVALGHAQTSLIVAALMIGGCRSVKRRPLLAGVLFGLMAFKPQFGVLLPVALISAREWRVIASAGVTGIVSGLASVVAFGTAGWVHLPAALAGLSAVVAQRADWYHLAPTVTAGMHMLGAGPGATDVAQATAALAAAVGVWFASRRGLTPLASAALMVGAFFATPYAFFYDLPVIIYAVLVVVRERHESGDGFDIAELSVLIAAVLLPELMVFQPLGAPWGMLVLGALFAVILRRIPGRTVAGQICA